MDERFRGRGLGGALLADAAARALSAEVAALALLVEAKDHSAVIFYEHHGFQRFASAPRTLFLPLSTAKEILLGVVKTKARWPKGLQSTERYLPLANPALHPNLLPIQPTPLSETEVASYVQFPMR